MIFFYNNGELKKEYSTLDSALVGFMCLNLIFLAYEISYFKFYQSHGVNLD
jgi:hypothetical protein